MFIEHRRGCAQCSEVEFGKPATFAMTCFDGAILLKEYLHSIQGPIEAEKQRAIRRANKNPHHVSKKKMQEMMRYK